MQSGREDTLEKLYAIKFCLKLGKNDTEACGMLQTAFGASCMNRESVFEWHKRLREGRESVMYNERCERSKEVSTPELIGQKVTVRVRVNILMFEGSSRRDSVIRGQHSSNLVGGISTRTMHQYTIPCLSQTFWPRWASRQFLSLLIVQTLLPVTCFFPNFRGCVYETIEEMKMAVTKVIDMLTQEDFHGAFQKLLKQYYKWIAAGEDF